jgi:hypothetical protein
MSARRAPKAYDLAGRHDRLHLDLAGKNLSIAAFISPDAAWAIAL